MDTLEEISAPDRLAALTPEWASLAAGTGNPLLHPDWSRACAGAWGAGGGVAVHALRRAGDLVAVAPLRVSPRRPARLVSLWDRTAEPTEFLAADEDALRELCERLRRGRRPLSLSQVCLDGALHRALADTGHAPHADTPRQTAWAPYAGGWQVFEGALSSNSRSWLRRKRRKLGADGEVTLDVVDPGPDDVLGALARLERVEAASWKGRAGTSIAQDPWQQQQLGDYLRLAAGRQAVRFFFLRVGDRDVAAHLYAVDGGRLWQLKIGYDEEFAAASPGIVLMHDVHRHACEQGLEATEYLGRAESWQERWPVVHRDHVRLRTYPPSLSGQVHRVHAAVQARRSGQAS